QAVARSPLRWQVLHWRAQHENLLPLHLPCANSKGKERPILCNGRRGGGSWISALSTLPSGGFAWNSGLARDFEHRLKSFTLDRRRRLGRSWDGRAGGTIGNRFKASSAAVCSAPGCAPEHRSAHSPLALRQKVDR